MSELPPVERPTAQPASAEQPVLKLPTGKFYFPWLTILACLTIIILQTLDAANLLSIQQLVHSLVLKQHYASFGIVTIALLLVVEYWLFTSRSNKTKQLIEQQQQQVILYSQGKKKQQQRANQFSDHSEKLKGFIADKLIEYMDFDEKFIHFKGIAAEVRHNGVISYDKITTALNKAIQQQGFLSLYEQQNSDANEPDQQTIDALVDYQGALDATRYLWALLDLSTADNMAMHIGNQLIECEENYYRLQLDQKRSLEITQSIPVSPTFEPQLALLTTFSLLINEVELNNRITLAKINPAILQQAFYFENEQFRIMIEPTPELLGNPNHIILLLENLLKNAQFFATKSRYKQKSDRIGISLVSENGNAKFCIYNRGPHIEAQMITDIFKLGFSTRRSKEHHGKGLGLFFAKEIVSGYQGTIEALNLHEPAKRLNLLITLQDHTQICYPLEFKLIDEKIQIRSTFEASWQREIKFSFGIAIQNISVQNNSSASPGSPSILFEIAEPQENSSWLDPSDPLKKHWLIDYHRQKKLYQISIKPLAVAGVEFIIQLPTAESHLEA